MYWVDNFDAYIRSVSPIIPIDTKYEHDLRRGGRIDKFLREKYLFWLEALSMIGSILQGVLTTEKLESLLVGLGLGKLFYLKVSLTYLLGTSRAVGVDRPRSRCAPFYPIPQMDRRECSASSLRIGPYIQSNPH